MKKFIFSIIVILLILIAADRLLKIVEINSAKKELQARQSANQILTAKELQDYASATQFRLEPYTVFGLKPNFKSDTVNVNSLGLRGREIEKKGENTYRIIVLGGSAVFGGEVQNDNLTFCAVLEKELNNSKKLNNKNIEVVNAGVPAYMSMQELILLENKLLDLKPDMVIVFDGYNDVITSLKRDPRPNHPWWFSEIEKVYYTSISKLFMEKRLKKYRPTKMLLNWLENKKNKVENYQENHSAVEYYGRNLNMICHLCESYGMNTVVVFQPVLFFKKNITNNERKILEGDKTNYLKIAEKMCAKMRDAAEEKAALCGAQFIDGSSIFDDVKDDMFIDEVHFNQNGHNLIGRALSAKISSK